MVLSISFSALALRLELYFGHCWPYSWPTGTSEAREILGGIVSDARLKRLSPHEDSLGHRSVRAGPVWSRRLCRAASCSTSAHWSGRRYPVAGQWGPSRSTSASPDAARA